MILSGKQTNTEKNLFPFHYLWKPSFFGNVLSEAQSSLPCINVTDYTQTYCTLIKKKKKKDIAKK